MSSFKPDKSRKYTTFCPDSNQEFKTFVPDTPKELVITDEQALLPDVLPPLSVLNARLAGRIPGVPSLPERRSIPDQLHELVADYHPRKGFWASLTSDSRAKVAQDLASQADALLRVQRAQTAAEVEHLLRAHHLWTAEMQALLEAEKTQTNILSAQHVRNQIVRAEQLQAEAAEHGLTEAAYQQRLMTEFQNNEQLRVEDEKVRIADESNERRKNLDHKLQQEIIDKEVDGTIRLGNTSELARSQMVLKLVDYGRKRDEATTDFDRQVWQREIDRLQKLLYEEPSRVAGKAGAGNDPEGGAPPAQSGHSNRGNAGPGKPPDSPEDSWTIN